jgi:hypothetical protein
MVDEVLKKKLKELKETLDKRSQEIARKILPCKKQFSLREEYKLAPMLNKIAIGILMYRKFDFDKERGVEKQRLRINNGYLQVCDYKCRTWNNVGFTTSYPRIPFHHINFTKAIEKIREMINAEPKMYSPSSYYANETRHIIDLDILPREVEILDSYSWVVNKYTITKLSLNVYEGIISAFSKKGDYEVERFLDDNFIYNQTLKLIEKAMLDLEKRKQAHELKFEKINQLIEAFGLKDYLVLATI